MSRKEPFAAQHHAHRLHQTGEQFAFRQIAGRAEQHENVWGMALFAHWCNMPGGAMFFKPV